MLHPAKLIQCLDKILLSPNPHEVNQAWSILRELDNIKYFDKDSMYPCNFDPLQLLKLILIQKPVTNVDQVPSILKWFAPHVLPNSEYNSISNDIARFLFNSAESFKERPCLAEIIQVLIDNRRIYLNQPDNGNLSQGIIEALSWIKIQNDIKKFNDDLRKIREFLKIICKEDSGKENNLSVDCFRKMCTFFLNDDRKEDPSSALIIVFQLVEEQLWNNHMDTAVSQIIEKFKDECKIVKMLSLFCKWIVLPPYTNVEYLSAWLTLFINSLEKRKLSRITKEVAEMILPSIFSESCKLEIFHTMDIQKNIILHLMGRIESLGLLHKMMSQIHIFFNTLKHDSLDPNNKKVVSALIKITINLLKQFSQHISDNCICSKVKILATDLMLMTDNQSYGSQIPEESEDMEVCYPSISNGFGRFNNVKVGLLNLGNTCYMNSVLQALAMTSQFCHEVLLYKSKNELSDQIVLKNLQNLFALLKYTEKNSLSPTEILRASRPSYFMPGHQQDSSEFLCHLLDVMYEQEKSAIIQNNSTEPNISIKLKVEDKEMMDVEDTALSTSPLNDDITNMYRWTTEENLSEGASLQRKTQSLADFTQGEELAQTQNVLSDSHSDSTDSGIQSVGGEDSTSSSASSTSSPLVGASSSSSYLVHRVFGGELKVTYQCITCDTQSDNTDKFRDLQLCFLDNLAPTETISVQKLINMNYFLPESLTGDNKYRCDKCEKLCDATRIIKILQAPAHLILTLKHFRYDSESRLRTKLRRKVLYNETIQMPVLDKSVTFRLYAAVVHSGYNMDYGHYVTYACDSRNRWYKFNDSYVSESSIKEFESLEPPDTPYILFYKRCGDILEADAPEFSALGKSLRDYIEQDRRCAKDHRATVSKIRRSTALTYKLDHLLGKGSNDDEDDNPPPSNCRIPVNLPNRPYPL